MNSDYNKINNNNNNNNNNSNQHHYHRGYHTHYASDNGLNFFLTGLKMFNQKSDAIQPPLLLPLPSSKSSSPPSPTKQSLLQHSPRLRSYQTAANAAADSARFCETFILHGHQNQYSQQQQLQQQQQQQHHHQHRHKYEQPLNKILSLRKNSPPESIHNASTNNRSIHNNNITANNQQHLQNCIKTYQPQLEHHQKRSITQSLNKTPRNITTEQHYQHYYSYYYNRNPTAGRESTTATTPSETKTGRKLPTHKMASTKTDFNAINQGGGGDSIRRNNKRDNTNKFHIFNPYQSNVDNRDGGVGGGSGAQHVLREKMPNNNIISQQFTPDEWLHGCVNDEVLMNAAGEFIDVKDFDVCDEKFIPNGDGHPSKLPALVLNKSRLQSGAQSHDNNANKNYNIDSELTSPNDNPVLRREIKLPATPIYAKVTRVTGGPLAQKKQSPPVHRVLIYNNSLSPRASVSNSPRLSPSTSRMPEFRRIRSKSPTNNASVVAKSKQNQHLYTNRLVESSKNTSADCYVHETKTLLNSKTTATNKTNNNKPAGVRGNKDDLDDDAAADNDSEDSETDDEFDDDLDNVSDFDDSYSTDSSSDYENGFRSQSYKITQSLDRFSYTTESNISISSSDEGLTNPESFLVPSLFPNVPPYLAFSSNTSKGPEVPPDLYRILKWRVTNVMPKVVRCVLSNSGVRLLKKTNDWMGTWGKHMKSPCFKTIRPYQKINHLPGSFKIGRKDACWKNLQKQMTKHGRRDFGFMPKTFIIPNDLNLLRKSWPKYAQRNVKWIIKPPASARGTGIRVINRWAQIPKRKPLIVQKYIERPLLINGSKFDLRLYVLVTSINPLRVYMYHNGLARFASVKYSDKADTLNDRCMHLTNYSINKFSSNYAKNEDVNACHGHKWTLKSLWSYLANRGIRTDLLWEALRNLVLRTILAGEYSINNMIKMNVESKYSCFELFGFDVLLDSELIPWLLEVNISPSLHSELPLDAHVKAPLVQGVLNTALYNVPPKLSLEKQKEIAIKMSLPSGPICFDKRLYINYLSRAEKVKHNNFTRKSMEDRDEYINAILEHLTPDDVRCLIVAEDELARCSPLERIFPTSLTYKYLKYTDSPRYYNRLLDAWESRYGNNRIEGVHILRKFCNLKYHLEVPPVPAKKYFEDDDTTYYLPPEQEHIESTAAPNIQDSNDNGDTTINNGGYVCTEENKTIELSKKADVQSADVPTNQAEV